MAPEDPYKNGLICRRAVSFALKKVTSMVEYSLLLTIDGVRVATLTPSCGDHMRNTYRCGMSELGYIARDRRW
jgi:hypothetical protein